MRQKSGQTEHTKKTDKALVINTNAVLQTWGDRQGRTNRTDKGKNKVLVRVSDAGRNIVADGGAGASNPHLYPTLPLTNILKTYQKRSFLDFSTRSPRTDRPTDQQTDGRTNLLQSCVFATKNRLLWQRQREQTKEGTKEKDKALVGNTNSVLQTTENRQNRADRTHKDNGQSAG